MLVQHYVRAFMSNPFRIGLISDYVKIMLWRAAKIIWTKHFIRHCVGKTTCLPTTQCSRCRTQYYYFSRLFRIVTIIIIIASTNELKSHKRGHRGKYLLPIIAFPSASLRERLLSFLAFGYWQHFISSLACFLFIFCILKIMKKKW